MLRLPLHSLRWKFKALGLGNVRVRIGSLVFTPSDGTRKRTDDTLDAGRTKHFDRATQEPKERKTPGFGARARALGMHVYTTKNQIEEPNSNSFN